MFRIYLRIPSINVVSKNQYCYQCIVQNISISRYGVTVASFQLNELSISQISVIPQFRLSSFSVSVEKLSLPSILDLMNATFALHREQDDLSFIINAEHCTFIQPKQWRLEHFLSGSQPLRCSFSLSVDHFNYVAPHNSIYLNTFACILSSDQQFSGSLRQIRINNAQTNVMEIKGMVFQSDSIIASSLFYHYSPALLDDLVQDVCSVIRFLPRSVCLSTFYHFIASLNQWKGPPKDLSHSTFDFPEFRDDKCSMPNSKLSISIPSCQILFAIDIQHCSQGSNRRVCDSSEQEDVHLVSIETSLSSSISSDAWVLRFMSTLLSDQNEGEIATIRTCLLNGFSHDEVSFLDIFFTGVSLSFSLSKFVTIFRIAQEVTFSVWCAMYDILEEFCQGSTRRCNDSFCRDRNHFYLDCSWKKCSQAARPSLRNRGYSDQREKEKLFREWKSTPATDGNQVERIRCEGLELQSEEDHWTLQVSEWGGNHLPSIDFYFNGISFQMENNAVIDVQRVVLRKRLICDSLLNLFEGSMREAKEMWGVTTGELLQRFEYCGEKVECRNLLVCN